MVGIQLIYLPVSQLAEIPGIVPLMQVRCILCNA